MSKPVREAGRDQLLGYLINLRQDQAATREWIGTWLDAHCPQRRKPGLDARTLRTVARRLRSRGRELDKKNKRNKALIGESPSQVRVGRACECDMQADNLLSEARSLESAIRKKAAK